MMRLEKILYSFSISVIEKIKFGSLGTKRRIKQNMVQLAKGELVTEQEFRRHGKCLPATILFPEHMYADSAFHPPTSPTCLNKKWKKKMCFCCLQQ